MRRQPSPDQAAKAAACPPAHISAVLIFGILCAALLRAGDQPARASASADLGIGTEVVLTEPGTMLRDGEKQIPNRGERIFKIQRLGNGFADVATEDGAIRGWVEIADGATHSLARQVGRWGRWGHPFSGTPRKWVAPLHSSHFQHIQDTVGSSSHFR